MPQACRRLKKVDVSFISLVNKGANQKTIIYKSAEGATKPNLSLAIPIKKTDEEQRMVYGIVYSPDEVDSQGDIAAADVIKDMAYSFMRKSQTGNVDQQHNFQAGDGFVAESWLVKSGDPVFPMEKEGSWAVGIKVEKNDTWELIKSGEITGLSLAGVAAVEEIQKSGILDKVMKFFHLKKDFDGALGERLMRDYVWSLQDAIENILRDETITDKKTAILESVGQFTTAISQVNLSKAGNTFNKANLKKLSEMKTMLEEMIAQVSATDNSNSADGGTPVNKSEGNSDMTPEQITAAIEKALEPINAKLTALEKAQTDKVAELEKTNTELATRLETVEKSTGGSRQAAGSGNDNSGQSDRIWT